MKRISLVGLTAFLFAAVAPFSSFGQCVPPVINTEPANAATCFGGNAQFVVAATGTTLTYRWQVDLGNGFVDLTNNSIYSGVTSAELNITGTFPAMETFNFRCIVDGACAPADTSAAVAIDLQTAPVIGGQPNNFSVCEDGNAFFNVTATGEALTYQWQVYTPTNGFVNIANGGVYSNATTNKLVLTGVGLNLDNNKYRCIVSNGCQTVYTGDRALDVKAKPAIGTQSVNTTVCVGSNATFEIAATGEAVTYQWEVNDGTGFVNVVNNTMYTGATTRTLNITGVTLGMNNYTYRCKVSGACTPAVNSTASTLLVEDMPAITAQASNRIICDGENTTFNITATGISIKYQWQVNTGSGFTDITNGGIYSNATTATLTLTAPPTSATGNRYRCKVSNVCSTLNSTAVDLTVNARPDITGQPVNSTICDGSNTSFTVAHTGTTMTYKWQVNTGSGFADITNGGVYSTANTATLNITGVTPAMSGYEYRCVLDNGNCSKNSGKATLTVNNLPDVTTPPSATVTCSGSNASFTVVATGTGISYKWQVDDGTGFVDITNGGIYSGATTATLNVTGATSAVNGFNYRCVVSGTCTPADISAPASLTVSELPAITQAPANSTICTRTNTMFAVTATGTTVNYQWQVNDGSGYANVINTGIYSGANTAQLNLTQATAAYTGYKYRCIVSGACTPAATSAEATLVVNDVEVMTETGNKSICEGTDAVFSLTVKGTAMNYQWQVNDGSGFTDILANPVYSGETTNTLTVNAPADAMNGYTYRCVVTGICTQDITTAMSMEVKALPEITQNPTDAYAKEGTNANFSVQAKGYNFYYYWQATTDNGQTFVTLSNNANYSGVSTNTLSLSNVSAAQIGYGYRCIVREIGGCNFADDISSLAYLHVDTKMSVGDMSKNSTAVVVYPNPVTGSATTLKLNENMSGSVQVRIVNAIGTEVSKQEIAVGNGLATVAVDQLPAGVYTLYVSDKDGAVVGMARLTKQ